MTIRHALLALLSAGPRYGLRLREEFEAGTGEIWPLNVGQVYSTLQRLERDGLVSSAGGGQGAHKAYEITSAGIDELQAWLQPPPVIAPPPRDELVIKVLVALRVPEIDVPTLIQRHRRVLVEGMQHYTSVKATTAEEDVAALAVADAEVFRLDALIRWLDATEARIRQWGTPRFAEQVAAVAVTRAKQGTRQ